MRSPATSCSATKPTAAPDLFQITADETSVRLYFSPVLAPRDRYVVSYGADASAEQHAFEWITDASGVIAVEVQSLLPHTAYHFKVRAGNGCQPGDWSNELAVTTGQRLPSYRWASLPRIITTAVAKRAKLIPLRQAEKDPSTLSPVTDAATSPITEPTPRPVDDQVASKPVLPSLVDRVVGFLKGLFGK
jgi:hypothetical protein